MTNTGRKLHDRAIEVFGTTDDSREAGWIMADGSMLDFSSRRYGGRGGYRQEDHTIIGEAFYDDEGRPIVRVPRFRGPMRHMDWFQDQTGAVRFSPQNCAFYIRKPLTAPQETTIYSILRWTEIDPVVEVEAAGRKSKLFREFRTDDEPERMLAVIGAYFGVRMRNPWLASGWVLPDGTYVPVGKLGLPSHRREAARILGMRRPERAFDRAMKEGWVRVGEATIQLPEPTQRAFELARDHVRETSPPNEAWDIRIEWIDERKGTVGSYRVPILEFMEMESIGDLRRYPREDW